MAGDWVVDRARGTAADFHAREVVELVERLVSVFDVDGPALVLGSTQPENHVDKAALAAAGVDLVRRRSGGGAVLLDPGDVLWVDVVVPRGDECWRDDVSRAGHWLGRVWQLALADLGVVTATVHTGALVSTPWSSLVCFAGLGPGEVSVGGRKLVGTSQRRTRSGARFQCVVHRHWDPSPLLHLLALDDDERARGKAALAGVATGLDHPLDEMVEAFLGRLPVP
jgi:lipoate-protein ligase A